MKKIIVILMTIFLSGCFSPSSPEYREELHKLEELVKNIKEENTELLRNNDFKTYDLDKLKEDIEILLKENFDKFDLEVKVKEKEIDEFRLWIIYCIIFSLIGFGVLKLHDIRLEKYPQEAKSYYEKQFENAGDSLIMKKYTDDFKVDMIKYGESKGYRLKETKIEDNWFTDDTTLIFEKIK
ncbi:hypothetical protein [Fusobacterium nucleatum]|uniref:hypothetical protein n=1 Tax=Fusobacterium nucleatum TaxID=851 RepID=UPI00356381A4